MLLDVHGRVAIDFDGLTDAAETNSNTNPSAPDTDDDGLLDGEESVREGADRKNRAPFQGKASQHDPRIC